MNKRRYKFVPITEVVGEQLKRFQLSEEKNAQMQHYYFIKPIPGDWFVSVPITNALVAFNQKYSTLSVKGFGIRTKITLDSPAENIGSELQRFIRSFYKNRSMKMYRAMRDRDALPGALN